MLKKQKSEGNTQTGNYGTLELEVGPGAMKEWIK